MTDLSLFHGKSVLVTGHTGFKGSWLVIWLAALGARVSGYGLAVPTEPSNYAASRVGELLDVDHTADVRDLERLCEVVRDTQPDFVFHLAAQPIVSEGYRDPVATFDANVMGTVNLLEAVRRANASCTVVVISSDKCYENREQVWGYRECDAMGGYDPYSASKGCTELVVASYLRSYFPPDRVGAHGVRLASGRAGNVVGGGDWARDRLIPDIARAIHESRAVEIRRPHSLRPWQHVLEPLSGYLMLAARLSADDTGRLCGGWNFGPLTSSTIPVGQLVDLMIETWGSGRWIDVSGGETPHEAGILRLSIDKAITELGWQPCWHVRETLRRTSGWYKAYYGGQDDMRAACLADIAAYEAALRVDDVRDGDQL